MGTNVSIVKRQRGKDNMVSVLDELEYSLIQRGRCVAVAAGLTCSLCDRIKETLEEDAFLL